MATSDGNAQSQLRKLVLFSSLAAGMAVVAVTDLLDHGLTRTVVLSVLVSVTPTYFAACIYAKLQDKLCEREGDV